MLKITKQTEFHGGSFHGDIIKTTLNKLNSLFGDCNLGESGDGKTNNDFALEIANNDDTYYCSVYDWKEYRDYKPDEVIEWHIGAEDSLTSSICKNILNNLIHIDNI